MLYLRDVMSFTNIIIIPTQTILACFASLGICSYEKNFSEECFKVCDDIEQNMDSWVKYSTSFFAVVAMLTAGENMSPITLYEKWFASIGETRHKSEASEP